MNASPQPTARNASLEELRRSFDEGFASPASRPSDDATEDLLLIRLGTERLAIRLREIAGIEARRKIVSIPGTATELLGLCAVRGRLVPVFSLAALLGAAGRDGDDGKWLILCHPLDPVGLAFSGFEGHARVPRSLLAPASQKDGTGYVDALVTIGSAARGVVGISALLADLRARASAGNRTAMTGDELRGTDGTK